MSQRGTKGVAGALALAAGALLAGCGGAPPATPGPPAAAGPLPGAPLETSFVVGGTSYAVLAMGILGQPSNTFWQLIARRPGSQAWTLVTPPGVADNGGLVVAAAGTRLTAAFLPSGALTFSPLAASSDAGATWSAAGLVPGALAPLPDALAGIGGGALALGTAGGAAVLTDGAGGSWTTVVTARTLAAVAGQACDLQALTAVAQLAGGRALVGVTCARSLAGVLVQGSSGAWLAAPLRLPPALQAGPVTVLRLTSLAGGSGGGASAGEPAGAAATHPAVAGLLAGGGADPRVAAFWASAGARRWSLSPALPLGQGARVVSTGFGAEGEAVAVWRDEAGHLHAATDAGAAAAWTPLPAPPAGTEAVVAGAGAIDALTVSTTVVTDWHLDASRHRWTRSSLLHVPIAFGSPS